MANFGRNQTAKFNWKLWPPIKFSPN